MKRLVDLLSPYQTHFFFPCLSLAQLPLTAAFSFSCSPALHCHSSSVSFSSPLPHGTTSVLEALHMPRWKGFRRMVHWGGWKLVHLFMSGVNLHASQHSVQCRVESQGLCCDFIVAPIYYWIIHYFLKVPSHSQRRKFFEFRCSSIWTWHKHAFIPV